MEWEVPSIQRGQILLLKDSDQLPNLIEILWTLTLIRLEWFIKTSRQQLGSFTPRIQTLSITHLSFPAFRKDASLNRVRLPKRSTKWLISSNSKNSSPSILNSKANLTSILSSITSSVITMWTSSSKLIHKRSAVNRPLKTALSSNSSMLATRALNPRLRRTLTRNWCFKKFYQLLRSFSTQIWLLISRVDSKINWWWVGNSQLQLLQQHLVSQLIHSIIITLWIRSRVQEEVVLTLSRMRKMAKRVLLTFWWWRTNCGHQKTQLEAKGCNLIGMALLRVRNRSLFKHSKSTKMRMIISPKIHKKLFLMVLRTNSNPHLLFRLVKGKEMTDWIFSWIPNFYMALKWIYAMVFIKWEKTNSCCSFHQAIRQLLILMASIPLASQSKLAKK